MFWQHVKGHEKFCKKMVLEIEVIFCFRLLLLPKHVKNLSKWGFLILIYDLILSIYVHTASLLKRSPKLLRLHKLHLEGSVWKKFTACHFISGISKFNSPGRPSCAGLVWIGHTGISIAFSNIYVNGLKNSLENPLKNSFGETFKN